VKYIRLSAVLKCESQYLPYVGGLTNRPHNPQYRAPGCIIFFLPDPSSSVCPTRVAVLGAEASPGIPKVEMWDVQERDGHFEVGTGRMRNPGKGGEEE